MIVHYQKLRIPREFQDELYPAETLRLTSIGLPFIQWEGKYPQNVPNRISINNGFIFLGEIGPHLLLALNLKSHHVVDLDRETNYSCFVNSSLERYVKTFEVFASGLPYRNALPSRDVDILGEKARALRMAIQKIDPPALLEDRFWSELTWDVANGDWDFEG